MAPLSNPERIKRLYQMLFEMATGNLNFRIEIHKPLDNLSEIEEQLNAVAVALQIKLKDLQEVVPHYRYQSLVQHTFVLNSNFQIIHFSKEIPVMLERKKKTLINTNIETILSEQSKSLWSVIKEDITNDTKYNNTLNLLFLTTNNQIIPLVCTVFKLYYSDAIVIASLKTIIEDLITTNNESSTLNLDKNILQNTFQFIINHLEEPLPTTKELSKMFSTNEFKLKELFRNHFNTSIYQFYNDERLKKAHLMIQQSNVPLKEIAYSIGFNDYVIFSKAFKKKFKYAPSQLKREQL